MFLYRNKKDVVRVLISNPRASHKEWEQKNLVRKGIEEVGQKKNFYRKGQVEF